MVGKIYLNNLFNTIFNSNQSFYDKCPTGNSYRKTYWEDFNERELNLFVDDIFNHYREYGFPYFPTDMQFRHKEYDKLKSFDINRIFDYNTKTIKQTMHGLSLAWSYMPHSWDVQCNNMMTPLQAFNDDEIFRKVIKKRLRFGDNVSDNGIRKMLKIYSGVQSVSNFRPTAAAAIYQHFCNPDDVVWDMSSGFGGRLLGASISNIKYIGTDPSTPTYNGLVEMVKDFNINATIHRIGSEDFHLEPNTIDFCFTSPPYFDTEKYSYDSNQSFQKYKTKNDWIEYFLKPTIKNCHTSLKCDKFLALNIANVKSFPDLEDYAVDVINHQGFRLVDTWKLTLSKIRVGGHKYEPIFIFIKEK